MNWEDFNTEVRTHLVAHNRRQGIQTLIERLIRAAVWDLVSAIPHYQVPTVRRFTTLEDEVDLAGKDQLPAGARVVRVLVENGEDSRETVTPEIVTDLATAQQMRDASIGAGRYRFFYEPRTGSFLLTPNITTGEAVLQVEFENLRAEFENDDETPFDVRFAEAVALYVLTRLALQVDRDGNQAAAFSASYVAAKRKLASDTNPALLTPKQP